MRTTTSSSTDHPLIGLQTARLDHRKLVATNTVELKGKLECWEPFDATYRQILVQNRHIQMRFDVRDAKAGDPEGMGKVNVWGEVYDSVHWATTPLSNRRGASCGLHSCMVRGRETPRRTSSAVGRARLSLRSRVADLLRARRAVGPPACTPRTRRLVDPTKFERPDCADWASTHLMHFQEEDGPRCWPMCSTRPTTAFPLQGALGTIQQTLFIGPNSLIVEGVADMLDCGGVGSNGARGPRRVV